MNQIICVQPISQSQQNNYLKLKYFIRVSFEKDNIVVILHAQIFHSKRCLPSSRSCRLRQNIGRNAANMVSMGCQSDHNEGAEWPQWGSRMVTLREHCWGENIEAGTMPCTSGVCLKLLTYTLPRKQPNQPKHGIPTHNSWAFFSPVAHILTWVRRIYFNVSSMNYNSSNSR